MKEEGNNIAMGLLAAWNRSTIVSGLVALMLIGFLGYCVVTGSDIPGVLSSAIGAVITYFFVEKSRNEDREQQVKMQNLMNGKKEDK